MAGDWIPIRTDLHAVPEVLRLSRLTGRSVDEVVGLLVRFWGWAQAHTDDGHLPDINLDDAASGSHVPSRFLAALVMVHWLVCDPEKGLHVNNFERWMSYGAKARLRERDKKRRQRTIGHASRSCPAPVPTLSRCNGDINGTTEKERRLQENDDDDDERNRGKGGSGGKPDEDPSLDAGDDAGTTWGRPSQELAVRRAFEYFGRMWGRAGPSVKRDRVLLWRLCAAACGGSDWARAVLETAFASTPRNPGAYLQRLILEMAPKAPNPAVWLRRFPTPYDVAHPPPRDSKRPPPETLDPPASAEEVRAMFREAMNAIRGNGRAGTAQ